MTTDPRIEAAVEAMRAEIGVKINPFLRPDELQSLGVRSLDAHVSALAAMGKALAAADAVDPLRSPTPADIERAAKVLAGLLPDQNWPVQYTTPIDFNGRYSARERYLGQARAVVAALRGEA